MKKLVLAAMLSLFGYAASAAAGAVVQFKNALPPCPGAIVTVQFIEYTPPPACINNGLSPVYPATNGAIYDLNNPATWAPTPLLGGQTYSAIVCITCPGLPAFCLPPVGIGPGATCDPPSIRSTPTPCCGTIAVDAIPVGGPPINYVLFIHP